MNNKPVAWMLETDRGNISCFVKPSDEFNWTPLYTYPVKPSICVGYWDNKTGAFHKNLTELQQKRVADGFLQAVYTEGMLPAKTLTDEEIIEIWSGMETDTGEQNIAFARAILRKAQEK